MSRKPKGAPACTPQSWEEADAAIGRIVDIDVTLMRSEARLKAAVARISARYALKTVPLEAERKNLCTGLEVYATANRKKLTDDGARKSVVMTNGTFGWRLCPASVSFKRGLKPADIVENVKTLIKKLEAMAKGPARSDVAAESMEVAAGFIRLKEEPNKEAMLEAQVTAKMVDGVKIVTGVEEFYIDTSVAENPEPK